MMRTLSTAALVILAVLVMAVYIPSLYGKIFFDRVGKTHLFYSPVSEKFIYLEKIVGSIPAESLAKATDHHAERAYRDQDGKWFTRVEFEKQLPFIYYRNMELWGLLPIKLKGRVLDEDIIKKNRQVLELKAGNISDRQPQIPLWPLLESNPDQARLVFPEDRFRLTADRIEFINVDTNTVDSELTDLFTKALKAKGFAFPARSVNGKFTILKPFDEGAFLVDNKYQVFHLKRRNGKPDVVKTPINPALKTRYIKISENRLREYYGLLLAEDGSLHMLTYNHYQLIRLPIDDYNPDRMDFKLIINLLYPTATYSDEATIQAVAMDTEFQPIARFKHRMSRTKETLTQKIYQVLFPFTIGLKEKRSGYLNLSASTGGLAALIGILISLAGFTIWHRSRRQKMPDMPVIGIIALTGIYGLITIAMIGLEDL